MYYVDKSLQENHPKFLGHVNDHFHYQNWWGHYFFFGLRPDPPPLRPLVRDPRYGALWRVIIRFGNFRLIINYWSAYFSVSGCLRASNFKWTHRGTPVPWCNLKGNNTKYKNNGWTIRCLKIVLETYFFIKGRAFERYSFNVLTRQKVCDGERKN